MTDYEENVFLEDEMANLDFPEAEIDGDKLEAMKKEANEISEFKKWFRQNTTRAFKNIAGIDSFINFLAEMPIEERKNVENFLKEKSILGNPKLEILFMFQYGSAFTMDNLYEGLSLMSKELNGINRTLADESIQHIMFLKNELKTFATLIKKAVQVSINEIEAAGARQQAQQKAQYELQVKELEMQIEAAKAEFAAFVEAGKKKHKENMEAAIMDVRKLALKDIAKSIKEVAAAALKDALGTYNMKHGFYTGCFVFGAMTLFTLCTKLFR